LFLSGLKTEDFLKKNIKVRKGKIIDLEGNILGDHFGTVFYTIGQRKGINLGGKGPYYVVRKDIKKNNLIVTSKKEDLFLFLKFAKLNKVNFVSSKIIFPANILVRTRYGSELVSSVIEKAEKKGEHLIFFKKKQRAITPGQSVVFYSKMGELLGGGIIN
jgi:tRNA-uridine 2-sulfurtransferase